ncbi:MAG: type II toxin-antitoxin system RelE/ParE family toxin [Acidimicrobiaceae bacterium]|nr:type II toxin-antitoxin system RelE/ParE family toxin [Acidimicrobiaceae bacterium]
MAWRIDYTDTAMRQMRKLNKPSARRIMDYMDERVESGDPRRTGRMLSGPLGRLWRYRVADFRVICDIQDDAPRVLVVTVARRDKPYR